MLVFENKSHGTMWRENNKNLRWLATIPEIGKIYENKLYNQYYWLAEGNNGQTETEAARVIEFGETDETVQKIWKYLEDKGKI